MRQRGSIYVYAAIAVAGIAALSGIYFAGYRAGGNAIRADWAAADQAAQAEADMDREERQQDAWQASQDLSAAQQKARDYEIKWKQAQKRPGTVLAACGKPPPVDSRPTVNEGQPPAPASPSGPPDGLRFTWAFVGLYDAAWTGQAGQPLYPDPGLPADKAIQAAPVGPSDLLDTHAENASRCSAAYRQLNALIDLILKFRAQGS